MLALPDVVGVPVTMIQRAIARFFLASIRQENGCRPSAVTDDGTEVSRSTVSFMP